MIIEYKTELSSNFPGTIIDIEAIGGLLKQYPDSRRYRYIHLVIFGFINKHALQIFCAKGTEALSELRETTKIAIDRLERPYYAFNTEFEKGVLFHELGKKIRFEGELQKEHESKRVAVKELAIPNYEDPFFDDGLLCMKAWEAGELDKAIAHNRACLLKERDILLKRGFRQPDKLKFTK